MGRVIRTGRREMHTNLESGNLEVRAHSIGRVGVESIILKWLLSKQRVKIWTQGDKHSIIK
jgi:hypothetical protein